MLNLDEFSLVLSLFEEEEVKSLFFSVELSLLDIEFFEGEGELLG